MREEEYLQMLHDTSHLLSKEKSSSVSNALVAYHETIHISNEVGFWHWLGENYPKDLSSPELIQQAALSKSRWLTTQLQGKGYEWDYMVLRRSDPLNILSRFDAGNSPTQPGIDITESNLFSGSVRATYQNKAYLSSNNPNLHNTPKEAIVVTNAEKVPYAENQGYTVEEYLDSDKIAKARDLRFRQALKGEAAGTYSLKTVAATSAKAGAIAAVIGMTIETVSSYKAWKNGEITSDKYLTEIFKTGGHAGITGGLTAAITFKVNAVIAAMGASTLISIPVAFVVSSAISKIIAPLFGRGEYEKYLSEARYYRSLESLYGNLINAINESAAQCEDFAKQMFLQHERHEQMKNVSLQMNNQLKNLYDAI
jgi:hypothetical protein